MNKRYRNIVIGVILVGLGLAALMYVWFENSRYAERNWTFSPYTMLEASWENYKARFINDDGRIIDSSQNDITTSEGQSYALLRSVWIDDKETFDKVWSFTKDNLQKQDKLFGWKWGELGNERYGFLPDGGENSATDADTDIALGLLLAANRWRDNRYRDEALPIIDAIWEKETVNIQGRRYLLAGTWANGANLIVLNPSYFAPYAYRYFAEVDRDHDWEAVIDDGYEILSDVTTAPLDTGNSAQIPPDWVSIDKATGNPTKPIEAGFTTNYSYDAIRVPWRIAIDYLWNDEPRAKEYLDSSFSLLAEQYKQQGKLFDRYSHSGEALSQNESPAMYAMTLAYFLVVDRTLADDLYQKKIIEVYSNGTNAFLEELPYYDQNLLWFGSALYNDRLFKL